MAKMVESCKEVGLDQKQFDCFCDISILIGFACLLPMFKRAKTHYGG
jgi:glucose dehydrogenase